MKRSPKFIFIVGFEKAATTTLANHLVEGYGCRYLVSGVKEPALFRCAPHVMGSLLSAHAASDSEETWLDATVDTVFNLGALAQIHRSAGDYRVIICVRNQFERALSAYRYYRECNRRVVDEAFKHEVAQRTGINWADRDTLLANGQRPPRYLRTPLPNGNYFYSCLNHLNDEPHAAADLRRLFDRTVERFMERSVEEQVLYEIYTNRTCGRWPALSILGSSYYGEAVRAALTVLDPGRVMLVSSTKIVAGPELERNLTRFLGRPASAHAAGLKTMNRSPRSSADTLAVERPRRMLAASFVNDSRQLLAALAHAPRVDRSLFAPDQLVWGCLEQPQGQEAVGQARLACAGAGG